MKKFKCTIVRTQYQTVEVEAESFGEAENVAQGMFDYDTPCEEYIEVYDMAEVTPQPTPTTTKE